MLEGPLLIVVLIGAIAFIVITTSFYRLHPFLSLIIATIGVGLVVGMPLQDIVKAVNTGFGGLMAYIGLVIVFGTIIGTILENSGGTIRIADVILKIFGKRRPALAMSLIGAIVSIPVFCDSGFVILSSLNKTVARRAKASLLTITIALSSGLYATHTLVPPTPGPLAAAGNLGAADYLGTVIGFGLLTSVPAILIGYWWALRIGKSIKLKGEDDYTGIENALDDIDALPSSIRSFSPIVLPLLLIGTASVFKILNTTGAFSELVYFVGNPLIALLIGVFAALSLMPSFDEEHLGKWIGKAIKQAGPILLITGAGGAFGGVLKATPLTSLIENSVATNDISGIYFVLIAFSISAALKISQGSSTAALVITSSLLAPILAAVGIASPTALALIVMAIGAGAMTVSHANDSYFWVVSQFGGIEVGDAYRSFTVVTLLQGCAVLVTTILLYALLV